VNFRIWIRELLNHSYLPVEPGHKLQIEVHGPHYTTIRTFTLETDDSGSVVDSFVIGSEADLGEYEFVVQEASEQHRGKSAGRFRVEEYKKPEFEVMVAPAKTVTVCCSSC